MTVTDMDRALECYRDVLSFEPLSDVEVAGPDYEQLLGVFGLRLRRVEIALAMSVSSDSNTSLRPDDRSRSIRARTIAGFSTSPALFTTWTRLIVGCESTRCSMLSPGRSGSLIGIPTPAVSRPFIFVIHTGIPSRY
ncbi:MAG: hypothetical protein WA970_08630 [Gammaproteobacteria bacterium]